MATKTIEVCDKCMSEKFSLGEDGTAQCENCKAKYKFNPKEKKWEHQREGKHQKHFINETIKN